MSDISNGPEETPESGVPAEAGDTAEQQSAGGQAPEQPAGAQPTAEQPAASQTQPTQPLPPQQPGYQAPQQPYQPPQYPYGYGQQYPQQPPYPQHPYGGAFGYPRPQKQPKPPRERKPLTQRTTLLIVAALVVGGLAGGGIGGGIAAGVSHSDYAGSAHSSTSGAQNITVNNPSDASQVTAVAADASPSVVTINVTASDSDEAGTGSGIVLTSDGYVLTNTHVVTLDGEIGDPSIQVQDNNGHIYTAKVIGTDPTDDLAVIKLQGASGMKPMTFADSSKLDVGQQVVAIGAPLGLSGTVTDGIVSALNRSIEIASSAAPSGGGQSGSGDGSGDGSGSPFNFWDFGDPGDGSGGSGGSTQSQQQANIWLPVIQTDAAINPGNSGGALLNAKGQLVGVNVAIASTGSSDDSSDAQSGSIGVGFAIPSDVARRIGDELMAHGSASHGLLGATVGDASAEKNASTVGAYIQSVTSGGAAAKAGLKGGDIVTNFDGFPITSADDLTAQVRAAAGGSKATLTYVRDGRAHDLSLTLGTLSTQS